ncbi:MAG TPA: DUF1573 domain-containing protein [Armatimonadota bacterium]
MRAHLHLLAMLALAAGTGSAVLAAPKIQFDKEILDFGTVLGGAPINASFQFKNVGDTDLAITNVRPGCGCTKAEAKKTKLAPGDSSTIEAVFNSTGYNGPINKSISVTTNDASRPSLALQIKAVISAGAMVKPASISFDNLRINGTKTYTLTVTPANPRTFEITKVVPVGEHVSVPGFRKVETNAGAYWEVYVVVKAGKAASRVMESIKMETSLGPTVPITATVYGNVVQ